MEYTSRVAALVDQYQREALSLGLDERTFRRRTRPTFNLMRLPAADSPEEIRQFLERVEVFLQGIIARIHLDIMKSATRPKPSLVEAALPWTKRQKPRDPLKAERRRQEREARMRRAAITPSCVCIDCGRTLRKAAGRIGHQPYCDKCLNPYKTRDEAYYLFVDEKGRILSDDDDEEFDQWIEGNTRENLVRALEDSLNY